MSNRFLAVLQVTWSWLAPSISTLAGLLIGDVLRRRPSVPTVRAWSASPTKARVHPAHGRLASGRQPLTVVLSPWASRRNHLTRSLLPTSAIVVTVQFGDAFPAC